MSSFGVKVIRALFGVAEHVAPRLAGRAAFELFCRTANPERMTAGEARAVERSAQFMADARHHRIRVGRGCVAVHEFMPWQGRPNARTVLVVHGWRSRTEFMSALISAYREAGFRVVSLDLPGHGASGGRRLTVVNAVDAIHVVGEWFGPFAAIAGHSFGGAVAVTAVAGSIRAIPKLDAAKLVLIAAPSSIPAVFETFFRYLKLGPRSRAAVAGRVARIAGRPLSDFTGPLQMAQTTAPTLVVHAQEDREVPAWHAEEYAQGGQHVRLHWAPGLGHRRILADTGVIKEAVDFVARDRAVAH